MKRMGVIGRLLEIVKVSEKTLNKKLAYFLLFLITSIFIFLELRMFELYPQPLPGITDASIFQGLFFVPELTSLSLPETAVRLFIVIYFLNFK